MVVNKWVALLNKKHQLSNPLACLQVVTYLTGLPLQLCCIHFPATQRSCKGRNGTSLFLEGPCEEGWIGMADRALTVLKALLTDTLG